MYNGTVTGMTNDRVQVTVGGGKLPTLNQMVINLSQMNPYFYLFCFAIGIALSFKSFWLGPIFYLLILIISALQGTDFQQTEYIFCAICGLIISNIKLNPNENLFEVLGINIIFVTLIMFALGGKNVLIKSPC